MISTNFDKTSNLWSGPKVPFPFAKNVTVGEVILKNLNKTPDRVTQISDDDGIELTCNELKLLSIRAAQNLMKVGLKKGDIVGFMAKNSTYMTPVIFGSLLAGIIVNPLDPNYFKDDIAHMFQQTQPKLVFCDADQVKKVQEALNEIKLNARIYTFIEEIVGCEYVDEILQKTDKEDQFVTSDLGDSAELIAAILCSSGTTGLSKGVIVSHASFLANLFLEKNLELTVTLHTGSIYWISAFLTMINAACALKTRIITTKPFSGENVAYLINKYKITQFFAAPPQAAILLNSPHFQDADLSHIKSIFTAGSYTSPELISNLKKLMPQAIIVVIYAMTEGGNPISLAMDGTPKGKVSFNVSIKVVDENEKLVGIGEQGEIWIKTAFPFLGYYNNPEANKDLFDADGFFATGDIGYFDDEGSLFLVDRKKDILKYLGNQISPLEIEGIIQKIDGVAEVSVIGIPDKKLMTDLATAMIIKKEGSQLKEDDVIKKIANDLQDHKHLRGGVFFVDEFPMTTSGKVIKRILKQTAIHMYKDKYATS